MASQPIALGSYVPAVDGLRALAVAGVIVHHLGMFGFASDIGWAGVWLFFVISGFVITNSVDGVAYRGQSFSRKLSIFWARRVRRIRPLYLLMIGVGTIIVLTVPGLRYQVEQLPYLLTFTYNFHRLSPDYSHTKLFGHYWSLSVEEQFYLLFPLIYFSVAGRARVAILVGWYCLHQAFAGSWGKWPGPRSALPAHRWPSRCSRRGTLMRLHLGR